jgi:hypothetical protein
MTADDNPARRPSWPAVLSVAVVLILGALLIPVLPRPPSAAARARFDQIQDGMTEDQVEGLLGGLRGVHDEDRFNITMISADMTGPGSSHLSWWYFPGCDIEVSFDKDARVCSKKFKPLRAQSLFDRAVLRSRQALHSPGS